MKGEGNPCRAKGRHKVKAIGELQEQLLLDELTPEGELAELLGLGGQLLPLDPGATAQAAERRHEGEPAGYIVHHRYRSIK